MSNIASLASAVLIFSHLHALFAWLNEYHFGSIRQRIWSFVHIPFPFALVLTTEGANQSIMWRAAMITAAAPFGTPVYEKQDSDAPGAAIAKTWDYTASSIIQESLQASKGLASKLDGLNARSFVGICVSEIRERTNLDSVHLNEDRLWSISNTAIFNTAGFGGQKKQTEAVWKPGKAITDQDME
ncbi:hypothetical protein DOTSEDRAFT_79426 [Dothistroma septosporum NZE10]|uniref:Uncharacterized protein n=1 Tax=Dothistroma septosporum (strain NZE10 / CBS 128990) TaxID=675120 RepID=N1PPT0_DOTSN|nr:hypothetical protein DOTSEDRAFT_79426 [Dothistroma septosporum NZE10]